MPQKWGWQMPGWHIYYHPFHVQRYIFKNIFFCNWILFCASNNGGSDKMNNVRLLLFLFFKKKIQKQNYILHFKEIFKNNKYPSLLNLETLLHPKIFKIIKVSICVFHCHCLPFYILG